MTFEKVLDSCQGLIKNIASKFYNCEYEDLYQCGVIGLKKAYDNYQNNKNTKFSTYAFDYIYGEMYKYANHNLIKVNRETLKLAKLIEVTKNKLAQKYNKIPTNLDIAKFLNIDISIIEDAVMALNNTISLESTTSDERSYYDKVKNYDISYLDEYIDLEYCLNMLNTDERAIIKERYFNDLTQTETAKKMGMTQVMVSRYEQKGIERIREYMMN